MLTTFLAYFSINVVSKLVVLSLSAARTFEMEIKEDGILEKACFLAARSTMRLSTL